MTRRHSGLVLLLAGCTIFAYACATKGFVQNQLSATESKLTERVDATESKLADRVEVHDAKLRETDAKVRETAERAGATSQAVNQLGAAAKTQAEATAGAVRDAEARLSERIASRNRYRLLETRQVYFDSGHATIRPDDVAELEEAARTLKADANAILEVQGFADPRGSDRSNNELTRDRVEAVIRHLVQHHGIELRQVRALAMGKETLPAGERPSAEALAKARRVDLRLLAPWSSWEDRQAGSGESDDTVAASPATSASSPATSASSPTTLEAERRPTPSRDLFEKDAPWRDIVESIPAQELGARD